MKKREEDGAHPCTTAHSHKKSSDSTFKGSIMFSKTMAKSSCNAGKITEEAEGFSEDDSCQIAARDFVVHKVIIFLVEAL